MTALFKSSSIIALGMIQCLLFAMTLSASASSPADIIYCRNQNWRFPGRHTSPDGKYTIITTVGDGEDVSLIIVLKGSKTTLKKFSSVQGFTWIPNKRHSLLFAIATDNDGGPSGLFLWDGTTKIKTLLKPKNDNQSLALVGVDGRGSIIYEYWPNLNTTNRKLFGPFIKKMRVSQ